MNASWDLQALHQGGTALLPMDDVVPQQCFPAPFLPGLLVDGASLEAERLSALHRCRILDTLPEGGYEDLVRLAAQMCETPIALISLVDAERQWFKARIGLDAEQTPRCQSFCAHAILQPDELLVVPDATRDPRFADNPLVTGEPGIRFYAGAPVVVTLPESQEDQAAPPSFAVGTLCVIDRAPRQLSSEQAWALSALARQVSHLLDLRLRQQQQRDTNHRLTESERRLQEAQLVARIGSWEFDIASGKITWSPEMFRLLGFDPAQGEPDYEGLLRRYHPEDVPMHRAVVDKAVQDGEPYEFDIRALLPDGTTHRTRWIRATGRGIQDSQGRMVRLMGTVQDITERKEMEVQLVRSEARLATLMRSLRGGVLVEDEQRHVVLANEAFCTLFQIPVAPEALVGMDCSGAAEASKELFVDSNGFISGVEQRLATRVAVTSESLPLRDGRHLERDYVPILIEDDYLGHLWVYRDVTARKQDEERLHVLALELQRSNEALQEFAHVASHDLKEPLRKIRSFGSMLQKRASSALDADSQDYLDRMTGAADRMQALIEGLLAYSRVSAKPAEFEEVDLSAVVGEVLTDLECRIAETGAVLEISSLPTVRADALQMRQLFQNLIGNALKYHQEGRIPRVEIDAQVSHSGESVTVRVKDNGIGFAAEHAERLFGVFERLVGRDKPQYEGAGVGLSICKKIVERHGGTITAEGIPGAGALFTVILPVMPVTFSLL